MWLLELPGHSLRALAASIAGWLDRLGEVHVYITVPVVLFMGLYWLAALGFACADRYLEWRGRLALHKHQSHLFGESFRFDWHKYGRTAWFSLRNQFVVSIPLSVLMYPLWLWRGVGYDAPFPSLWTMLWQVAVVIFVQEAGFFLVHRWLHRPALYKRIHRRHHDWISPVAVGAHSAHPFEHFLANSVPFLLGPFLVGLHWQLFLLWFAVATLTVVRAHSGYRWPVLGSPDHDRHHQMFTVNFGIMLWFDRWLGTVFRGR